MKLNIYLLLYYYCVLLILCDYNVNVMFKKVQIVVGPENTGEIKVFISVMIKQEWNWNRADEEQAHSGFSCQASLTTQILQIKTLVQTKTGPSILNC